MTQENKIYLIFLLVGKIIYEIICVLPNVYAAYTGRSEGARVGARPLRKKPSPIFVSKWGAFLLVFSPEWGPFCCFFLFM